MCLLLLVMLGLLVVNSLYRLAGSLVISVLWTCAVDVTSPRMSMLKHLLKLLEFESFHQVILYENLIMQ